MRVGMIDGGGIEDVGVKDSLVDGIIGTTTEGECVVVRRREG